MTTNIRWHLKIGPTVVAQIADAHAQDWPWTYGTVVDSPEFETYRKYFTDPDSWDEDDPEIDQLIETIDAMGEITLCDFETGRTYVAPTINQSGNSIWFRLHLNE